MENTKQYHTKCPLCDWYSEMVEVEMYPSEKMVSVCPRCAGNIQQAWEDDMYGEEPSEGWSLDECIRCTNASWINFLGLCSSCSQESLSKVGIN